MAMKISIGSDHAGFEQKQELAAYLREQGYDVIDRGPDSCLLYTSTHRE